VSKQNYLLHQLFEHQAHLRPEAIALIADDQKYSYRELNERSNQLAHYLIENGVCPDSLVGLYVDRSVEMLVGMLAVLKAGGAYVPLDAMYPEARLDYILEDANPNIVVTVSALVVKVQSEKRIAIAIDTIAFVQLISQYGKNNPDIHNLNTDNLAYVIYTSGSTGYPKGVLVEHHNVTRLLGSTE